MTTMSLRNFFRFLLAHSAEIIDAVSLKKKLGSGRTLRVKLGIDPTTPDLHLGHIVPLRMLRVFQDAGHHAVLIIGDFTGQIGDPSGKSATRRQLTPAEAKANERTYRTQISRVLDMPGVEIRHNSEWYGRMRLDDFLDILTNFSLKSAWERDDFQKRVKAGKEVRLHEAMYHVLQAYDSVMVRADVEIGSLDQKLNVLAGRELQKRLGFRYPPQDIVLMPYLIGLAGKHKMSKTVGNTINLTDAAPDMFGKVMAIPDALIENYAKLAAWLRPDEIGGLKRRLEGGENPRDVKLEIAGAVVRLYHGAAAAAAARREFLRVFSERRPPAVIPAVSLAPGVRRPVELLLALKAAASKSQARRLIAGGALSVDGVVVAVQDRRLPIRRGSIIRVGKKRFFRAR